MIDSVSLATSMLSTRLLTDGGEANSNDPDVLERRSFGTNAPPKILKIGDGGHNHDPDPPSKRKAKQVQAYTPLLNISSPLSSAEILGGVGVRKAGGGTTLREAAGINNKKSIHMVKRQLKPAGRMHVCRGGYMKVWEIR